MVLTTCQTPEMFSFLLVFATQRIAETLTLGADDFTNFDSDGADHLLLIDSYRKRLLL